MHVAFFNYSSSYRHDDGGNHAPGPGPVGAGRVSGHLLDAARELLGPEDPSDRNGLKEAAPEDGDPAGAVEVHELEDVGPALGHHGHAQEEQGQADQGGEEPSPGPEGLREHVHDPRHQTLHDAELAVNPDRLEGEREKMCSVTFMSYKTVAPRFNTRQV